MQNTVVPVYPSTMSDLGHHLLNELSEPYMDAGQRKPPPFTVEGIVVLDGIFRHCRVEVDLFNWTYRVSGVGESSLLLPQNDPALLRRAVTAGEQLIEMVASGQGGRGMASFFHLNREIVC